jgi:hypothetical protein
VTRQCNQAPLLGRVAFQNYHEVRKIVFQNLWQDYGRRWICCKITLVIVLPTLETEFSSQSSQMAMQLDDVYLGSRERTVNIICSY